MDYAQEKALQHVLDHYGTVVNSYRSPDIDNITNTELRIIFTGHYSV